MESPKAAKTNALLVADFDPGIDTVE